MRGDWVMHVASNCDFPQVTVRLVVHYVSDSGGMARSSILVRRPERVKNKIDAYYGDLRYQTDLRVNYSN